MKSLKPGSQEIINKCIFQFVNDSSVLVGYDATSLRDCFPSFRHEVVV